MAGGSPLEAQLQQGQETGRERGHSFHHLVHQLGEPGAVVGDIWLCGGGILVAQLLPEIDELVLKRYRVVAGGGIPAFAGQLSPRPFVPVETLTFSHGGTVTTYRPTGG